MPSLSRTGQPDFGFQGGTSRSRPQVRVLLPALLLGFAVSGCGGCSELLVGPEKDIAATLKGLEARGTLELPGTGTLKTERLLFDRLLVKPEGNGYTAVSNVDLDGAVDGLRISYIGFERIPFVRRDGRFVPSGSLTPNLVELLEVLRARADAFSRGDAAAYEALLAKGWEEPGIDRAALLERLHGDFARGPPARIEVTGWTLRNDRHAAEVTEEYRLHLGEGQPPRQARARYTLKREDGRFRFASGLR